MTHLKVDAAAEQLARRRHIHGWVEWLFGGVCGVVLYAAFGGDFRPVSLVGSGLVALATALHGRHVEAAEREHAEAVVLRDEWRHERVAELHEEELAELKDTIVILRRELAQRDTTIN